MNTRTTLALALLGLTGALTATTPSANADPQIGEFWFQDIAPAFTTTSYRLDVNGGEFTTIWIDGDGDTDLDLVVKDRYGRILAQDTDLSDECLATFYAGWDQDVVIEVINHGRLYNVFTLGGY